MTQEYFISQYGRKVKLTDGVKIYYKDIEEVLGK